MATKSRKRRNGDDDRDGGAGEKRGARGKSASAGSAPAVKSGFDELLAYLRRARGFDFANYKRPGLARRFDKRMQTLGVSDYEAYLDYLEVHPEEFAHLFNTILINVTGFFRDPDAWEYLAAVVIPDILRHKGAGEPVRAWSAGCASGEEAYSLAMILAEAIGMDEFCERVKIYATDVDEEALAQARLAAYTDQQVAGIPPALLKKYFDRVNGRYVFNKEMRRCVIFGRHDLFEDAPISKVDLLACRNALMYFNAEAQARILSRFHFALVPRGVLFLGKAETLLAQSATFEPVDVKRR